MMPIFIIEMPFVSFTENKRGNIIIRFSSSSICEEGMMQDVQCTANMNAMSSRQRCGGAVQRCGGRRGQMNQVLPAAGRSYFHYFTATVLMFFLF